MEVEFEEDVVHGDAKQTFIAKYLRHLFGAKLYKDKYVNIVAGCLFWNCWGLIMRSVSLLDNRPPVCWPVRPGS